MSSVVCVVTMAAVANPWLLIGVVAIAALYVVGIHKFTKSASGLKQLEMYSKCLSL